MNTAQQGGGPPQQQQQQQQHQPNNNQITPELLVDALSGHEGAFVLSSCTEYVISELY